MSMADWTPERRQEIIDSGKVTPEELRDLMQWEAEQCYQGIGILRDLADETGDQRIKDYADVLDFTVRRRIGWETEYYDRNARQSESQYKFTRQDYQYAWEESRTGGPVEIAGILGVNYTTVNRRLKDHPDWKLPKKNKK